MTLTGHILPVAFVVGIWFASTALVVWLDNRAAASFGRSLVVMGLVALAALGVVVATAASSTMLGVYTAFAATIAVWGWHELSFLTGAAAGPRRLPCPEEARGWERFRLSAATVMHHEIALAVTAILLAALTWRAANPVAGTTFALLFGMRLSTKLNIFLGVPNFSTEILPPQLAYLKGYFRRASFNALMPFSLVAGGALTLWLGQQALATDGSVAVGWSLLTTLALLGLVEHIFLVLPLRDSALWRWAIPTRANG